MVIDAMDLLYSERFDGFCIVSSDSDFTRLAARIRESGLTVYGFGERKTPKPFVAACDKFIYIENLTYAESAAAPTGAVPRPTPRASAREAQGGHRAGAASCATPWRRPPTTTAGPRSRTSGTSSPSSSPDFDSRNYGYAKLSDLMAATTLFELDRRSPGDGKPGVIYARDKRQDKKPKAAPVS